MIFSNYINMTCKSINNIQITKEKNASNPGVVYSGSMKMRP